MQKLILVIDGVTTNATDVYEALPRAVLISLFSWARAQPDDILPGNERMGWFGDSFPLVPSDKTGSRLWLLMRGKLTAETVLRAKEYTEESLQWLIEDGVANDVQVQAERQGLSTLALGVKVIRGGLATLDIRFTNVWGYINGI